MVGLLSFLSLASAAVFLAAVILLVIKSAKKQPKRLPAIMAGVSVAAFLGLSFAVSKIYVPIEKPPAPSIENEQPVSSEQPKTDISNSGKDMESDPAEREISIPVSATEEKSPTPPEKSKNDAQQPAENTGRDHTEKRDSTPISDLPETLDAPKQHAPSESVPTAPTAPAESAPPATSTNYNALQQLYLDVSPELSYTEMIDLIKSTGLPFSEEKYNGSRAVQVAFTEGCTAQSYKKEVGDYLEIHYNYPRNENSINDELEKYYFGTCVYNPSDSQLSLISHESGYYFSIYEPGNYIMSLGSILELDVDMSRENQLQYYIDDLNRATQ